MNRALRNSTNIDQPLPEKHVTRAGAKAAAGDQPGVAPRRGALVDQRNIIASKPVFQTKAARQEIAKKCDAKKARTSVVEKEAEKVVVKDNKDAKDKNAEMSFTESRFDTVVLHCDPFKEDVENYMFYLEKRFGVPPDFLNGQEVTSKMRYILIDWLVQVHVRFHLLPETLYLGINILDRYMAKGLATKDVLQLVGVACLSGASKYEEIFPPEVTDYIYVSENSLKKADIIRMEYKILAALDSDLGRPTVIQFLRRLSTFFNPSVHIMAKFISENMVINYATCHLRPSVIAAVSVWLAAILESSAFPPGLYTKARVTKQEVHQLAPKVAANLLELQKSRRYNGVRDKYNNSKCGHISHLAQEQIAMLSYIAGQKIAPIAALP